MCRKACAQDLEEAPCGGCEYAAPELEEANEAAWGIYGRVRLCRRGDFQSSLDWETFFHVMELEGLEGETQLETFNKVNLVEAEMQRRWGEEKKED